MPMNTVIRTKRKELGFTQEQIADYLGVSTPAVNKWESGTTCPDIALLPPLARLLKMDINTLLCFHETLTEQEINHFLTELTKVAKEQGIEAAFAAADDKVREYPNCGVLIHSTSLTLDGTLMMSGMTADEKKTYESRILSLYEQAADCDDEKISVHSRFMLASKYVGKKEYGKAQEMLDTLPERDAIDKRVIQASLYTSQEQYGEAAAILERILFSDITQIQSLLVELAKTALKEGNRDAAVSIAEVSEKSADLFGLWDYYRYLGPFCLALAEENVSESLSYLDSLLSTTETPWRFGQSPLFRHMDMDLGRNAAGSQQALILKPLLSELEQSPRYDFLRASGEFKTLLHKYHAKLQ